MLPVCDGHVPELQTGLVDVHVVTFVAHAVVLLPLLIVFPYTFAPDPSI